MVYCKDCKWHEFDERATASLGCYRPSWCHHPNNITQKSTDDWYQHKMEKAHQKYPKEKNANNDCPDFEEGPNFTALKNVSKGNTLGSLGL